MNCKLNAPGSSTSAALHKRTSVENAAPKPRYSVYPVAVANPIWIDADGDGKIAPASPYRP
jgi:hypothetical protein